jgi:hypothetical protein
LTVFGLTGKFRSASDQLRQPVVDDDEHAERQASASPWGLSDVHDISHLR